MSFRLAKTPVDRQAGEASASRYPDAFGSPKLHTNIDADLKRVLESALKRIQIITDSPYKPMHRNKGVVGVLVSGLIGMGIRDSAGNTPLHILVNQLSPCKEVDPMAV